MPRVRETVPVRAGVLEWARVSLGLSREDAAARLKVSPEELHQWETAGADLGITALHRLAAVYQRPMLALLLDAPPLEPGLPEDFRTVEGAALGLTPETRLAIRAARRIQEIANDLIEDDPELFPKASMPEAHLEQDPTKVADGERERLGVAVATQLGWGMPGEAYHFWRARLQELGVLVLDEAMDRLDCRGLSLWDGVPAIVVNTRAIAQARTFTAFHEYGHLLLRRAGICLERPWVTIESWCNRFAAALLVPASTLTSLVTERSLALDSVRSLAGHFKVSRHVVALRLADLQLTDQELYQQLLSEGENEDWRTAPVADEKKQNGGPSQSGLRLAEVGSGFAGMVLGAMHAELISASDASDFLRVGLETLPKIEQRLAAERGGRGDRQ